MFDLVLIVKDLCSPIGLNEKVARGKKERKREQICRQSRLEDVKTDWSALRGIEFIRWVVLISIIDEATPLTSTNNLNENES